MKTNILVSVRNALLILVFASVVPVFAFAQTTSTDDTAAAVAAGQQLWQQLGSKQISCEQLTDSDYEQLGEYFMGAMMGSSHERMNEILKSRFGVSGEERMHITMGKRFSGCDTNAAYPAGFQGFAPMMGGNGYGGSMMGYGSNYYDSNYGTSMMNGYGLGGLAMGLGGVWLLFNILWWVVIVAAVIWLVRRFFGTSGSGGAPSLDILKDRYAKGEIDKAEFESKKKDITS
ncbi:MAG: SHOCT domain-containing protein [Patescibacteria group bacterium]